MKISAAQRRPLGATGLAVPPIIFGTAALANQPGVIAEQRKLAICGEWFQHIEPPVFVDVSYRHGDGMALEVLARLLRRLDITRDEVVIHLSMDSERVEQDWKKSCLLLDDEFCPKLLSIVDATKDAWQIANDLRHSARICGMGLVYSDGTTNFSLPPDADWLVLSQGLSVMHDPRTTLPFLSGLVDKSVPIIVSGVFGGGFLVGGNCLNGRLINSDDPSNRSLLAWRTAFVALCHGHGVTPAHACIQFALSAPGVVAVKLDSSHPDRVAANVQAVATKVPDAFWASMKEEGLLSTEFPIGG
jgi:D-threo-aldose 1-dehydrogenase